MWDYERKLMYPVKIKNPNPELARYVISQYGGPYLNCLSFSALISKTRISASFRHLRILLSL